MFHLVLVRIVDVRLVFQQDLHDQRVSVLRSQHQTRPVLVIPAQHHDVIVCSSSDAMCHWPSPFLRFSTEREEHLHDLVVAVRRGEEERRATVDGVVVRFRRTFRDEGFHTRHVVVPGETW